MLGSVQHAGATQTGEAMKTLQDPEVSRPNPTATPSPVTPGCFHPLVPEVGTHQLPY